MNEKTMLSNGEVTRREFTKISTLALTGIAAGVSVAARGSVSSNRIKMFKNLGCGHIGVKANQVQAIEYAAQFGFEGVNAHIHELEKVDESERQDLVDQMKQKEIRFGVSGLPVDFRKDESKFKDDMALLPQRAKILQSVGVNRISTWILSGHNELTYRENFERHRKRLKEAAKILNDHEIRLGLEFVGPRTFLNRFRFPFIHTQPEMMELAHAIGTGNVGLLLDAWHWHTSHGTLEEIKQLTNEDIVNVHVNDAPKGVSIDELIDNKRELPLATGVIDLKGFINVLAKMKYDGPVTCEPFNQELNQMDNEAALGKTINALNKLFGLIEV